MTRPWDGRTDEDRAMAAPTPPPVTEDMTAVQVERIMAAITVEDLIAFAARPWGAHHRSENDRIEDGLRALLPRLIKRGVIR